MNRQLDILFIHPNASKKIYQDLSNDYSAIEPPIWAAMLAQHCRSNGFGSQILDCEAEGIIGPVAGIIGSIQANEVLKKILSIGRDLKGLILIINLLSLNFRSIKYTKKKNCICRN